MKNATHHQSIHPFFRLCLSAGVFLAAFGIAFATMAPGTLRAQDEGPKSGTVTVAVKEVKALPEGADEGREVAVDDIVAVGETIVTGAESRAVIVLTPRSAIRVSENSEVVIAAVDESASPQKVLIEVKDGGLSALLKPNAAGEMDFQIKTPTGVAAARGTFYAVVVEDGKGYVQVKEGRVEITPEGAGN